MTLFREKINRKIVFLFFLVLFVFFSLFLLLEGTYSFGKIKGILFALAVIFLCFSFFVSFFLSSSSFLRLYIMLLPFFMRLNQTRFRFELFGTIFYPFFFFEILFLIFLTVKLLTEKEKYIHVSPVSFANIFMPIAFLMMFVGGLVSSLITPFSVSGSFRIAFISYIGQIVIPTLIFIVVFLTIKSLNELKSVLNIFFLSFIVNVFVGLFTFISSFSLVDVLFSRLSFNFLGANNFGAVAQLFIPLGFYFSSVQKTKSKSAIYFIFTIFIIISVFLTVGRGAILSMSLSVILLYMFSSDFRPDIRKIFFFSAVALLSSANLIMNAITRFQNIFTRTRITEFSTLIRVGAWDATIRSIPSHLLGIGGNQFPLLWRNVGRFPEQMVLHSHNFILGFTIEYGIISTLGFIIVILIILSPLIAPSTNIKLSSLSKALFVSVFSFIFSGTVSEGPRCHLSQSNHIFNDGLVYFFIFIALVYKFIRLKSDDAKT